MKRTDRPLPQLNLSEGVASKLVYGILLFVLASRIFYVLLAHHSPILRDQYIYDTIASNLQAGKGFLYPPYNHGQPTSFVGPIYPFFLAAIYSIFGHSYLPVRIIQAIIGFLTCIIILRTATLLFKNRLVSVICIAMFAVYVPFIMYSDFLLTETLYTFSLASFFLVFLIALNKSSSLKFLAAGLLIGITTLCRAPAFLLPFFLLAVTLVLAKGKRRTILKNSLVMVFGMVIVLTPWTIRNYKVHHRFVPLSTQGGRSFWFGNLAPTAAAQQEYYKEVIRLSDEGKSEAELNVIFFNNALKEIRRDPLPFVGLFFTKFLWFWFDLGFPDVKPPAYAYMIGFVNAALMLLAMWGLISRSYEIRTTLPIIVLLVYFTLVHMAVIAYIRFSMPITPYLMMLSSIGLVSIVRRYFPNLIRQESA